MALVGSAVIGPRTGRFERGKPVPIGGHTVPVRIYISIMNLSNFPISIVLTQVLVTACGG